MDVVQGRKDRRRVPTSSLGAGCRVTGDVIEKQNGKTEGRRSHLKDLVLTLMRYTSHYIEVEEK